MVKRKVKSHGLSKRGQTKNTQRNKMLKEIANLPTRKGITPNSMVKYYMGLNILKSTVQQYLLYKDTPELDNLFRSLSRNIQFDLTGVKLFSTGAYSTKAWRLKGTDTKLVRDHFFQRTKSLTKLFEQLVENPKMTVLEFIDFLIENCSTVFLTKEEHSVVNTVTKQHPQWTNHKVYKKLGIKFHNNALNEFIKQHRIGKSLNINY